MQLAFEHHGHAFKVTHPIKGVTYLGDGCLGVKPRAIKNKTAWYLEDAQAVRNYYFIKYDQETLSVTPKNIKGEQIHPLLTVQKPQLSAQ